MFGRIWSEFQCLEEYPQSSNVWKDKIRIPVFGGISQTSSGWKNKVRIRKFERMRSEFQGLERYLPQFQYLEGYGQNSNVCKNKGRITMFRRKRSEFQCMEE